MPVIADIVDSIMSLVVQAINAVFSLLFFWLPDDPFLDAISSVQSAIASAGQGVTWLAWFIDIEFFAGCVWAIISCLLAWGVYKIAVHVFRTVARAVELIPFE